MLFIVSSNTSVFKVNFLYLCIRDCCSQVRDYYSPQSLEGRRLAAWSLSSSAVVRVVKLVAIVRPGVLGVLQCYALESLSIPMEAEFPGWRCVLHALVHSNGHERGAV